MRPQLHQRVNVLDLPFDAVTLEKCVDLVLSEVRVGAGGWVSTVNVAILMMMRSSRFLDHYVRSSRWILADGQPLVWLSRLLRWPLPERVSGVDLLEVLCARAAASGLGVYLIGGSPDVVARVALAMRARHPRLDVSHHDGYFGPDQADEVAQEVVASGASLVFVGMGVPRQEQWIADHLRPADHGLIAVGVGGSFDVIAGLRRRAPVVLQLAGLEWVVRLVQEPKRLWRRYLTTGWAFLLLAVPAALRARLHRPDPAFSPPTVP
jgi:N-acetylglucosaminyldiphosphoundecaprenol N-acetyl-beta-D-mannosaminyltransferase